MLLLRSGCRLRKQHYNFNDAQRIADSLNNNADITTRVVIMDADCMFKVVFKSSPRPMAREIVLILHKKHYDFIGEARQIFQVKK